MGWYIRNCITVNICKKLFFKIAFKVLNIKGNADS